MDVEQKMQEVLLEILDIKATDIVPTATFIDDLKATSIDLVEIFTALQNAFDIDIDEAQVAKVKTVQDATELVKSAIVQKGAAS
jgi:acyl carrier protein